MKQIRFGTLAPLGIAILTLNLVLLALVLAPGTTSARCIPQFLELTDGGGDEWPETIVVPEKPNSTALPEGIIEDARLSTESSNDLCVDPKGQHRNLQPTRTWLVQILWTLLGASH